MAYDLQLGDYGRQGSDTKSSEARMQRTGVLEAEVVSPDM